MKKRIAWILAALLLLVALAPIGAIAEAADAWEWWDEDEDGEMVYGRTTAADVRLRSSDYSRAQIVAELPDEGTMVILLGVGQNTSGEDWFYVQVGETVGYVQATHVEIFSYEDLFALGDTLYGYTNAENVKLREGNHSRGKIIAELPDIETMVVILNTAPNNAGEEWHYVRVGDYEGYLPASSIDLITQDEYETFAAGYGHTNQADLKMRETAYSRGKIVVELSDAGTLVSLLEPVTANDGSPWYKVQVGAYEGYLPAGSIDLTGDGDYEAMLASASSRERSGTEALASGYAWIVPNGDRYHRNYKCSNMNGPWQVSVEEAEEYGLIPCMKCW